MAAGANAGYAAIDVCWNAISGQQDSQDISLRDIHKLPPTSDIPAKGGEESRCRRRHAGEMCAQRQGQCERRTVGETGANADTASGTGGDVSPLIVGIWSR